MQSRVRLHRPGLATAVLCAVAAWNSPSCAAQATAETVQVQLRPLAEATLSSRMAGTITQLEVRVGEAFRRGATLVVFDCALAEQDSRKARADLDIARATLASSLKLSELDSISALEVDVARAQQDKAAAEYERTRAQLGFCRLEAPWDGRVVERTAHPLENVTVGQPLLAIVASGTPTLQMFAPSASLASLAPGSEFDVSIRETGKRYRARVLRSGARVDAVSQTIEVFAEFTEEHPELLPGMSGAADLGTRANP